MSEARLDPPYEAHDASPFAPSGAIYFMDGRSDATVELKNGDVFTLEFHDAGTSIAASAPLPHPDAASEGVFVPVPPPLPPIAVYPAAAPERLNGPIPLFDVEDPGGGPQGEIKAAHHESGKSAEAVAPEAWPWHSPNLDEIDRRKESR
jgi:hypothetical protein